MKIRFFLIFPMYRKYYVAQTLRCPHSAQIQVAELNAVLYLPELEDKHKSLPQIRIGVP